MVYFVIIIELINQITAGILEHHISSGFIKVRKNSVQKLQNYAQAIKIRIKLFKFILIR
jgi:hypothetical protein